MVELTRDDVVEQIQALDLDEFDKEDAENLVDLLMESYDGRGAMTWLFFYNLELHDTPLCMLRQGRSREVFQAARKMVAHV